MSTPRGRSCELRGRAVSRLLLLFCASRNAHTTTGRKLTASWPAPARARAQSGTCQRCLFVFCIVWGQQRRQRTSVRRGGTRLPPLPPPPRALVVHTNNTRAHTKKCVCVNGMGPSAPFKLLPSLKRAQYLVEHQQHARRGLTVRIHAHGPVGVGRSARGGPTGALLRLGGFFLAGCTATLHHGCPLEAQRQTACVNECVGLPSLSAFLGWDVIYDSVIKAQR